MRTTLDIDPVVIAYAKGAAKHQKKTIGQVVSELARRGLQSGPRGKWEIRNGFPQLARSPNSEVVITNEYLDALLEESE